MNKFLDRFTIRGKILALVIPTLALLGVTLWIGISGQSKINGHTSVILNEELEPMAEAIDLANYYAVNMVDTAHKVASGSMSPEEGIKSFEMVQSKTAEHWDFLNKAIDDPGEVKRLEEAKALRTKVDAILLELIAATKAGDLAKVNKIRNTTMYPAVDPLSELIGAQIKDNLEHSQHEAHAGLEEFQTASRASLVVGAVAAVFALILGLLIAKRLSGQSGAIVRQLSTVAEQDIARIRESLEALAKGNLTTRADMTSVPVDVTSKDEFGQLNAALNNIIRDVAMTAEAYEAARNDLRGLVNEIQGGATNLQGSATTLTQRATDMTETAATLSYVVSQVAESASHSAEGAQRIAEGSSTLSKNASETNAQMEAMATLVGKVSDGSQVQREAVTETNEGMSSALSAVERTREGVATIRTQIESTSETVSQLGEKGQQIGEIVKTIEDIAEQTNLLALNAAIEAARAGDAGRGFAVVADEVRKLAERSAQATKTIAELINSVRADVGSAVSATSLTQTEIESLAAAADAMVGTIEIVSDSIAKVDRVATENIKLVNTMKTQTESVFAEIEQVSATSEQNASGAEELSATAEESAASAQEMSASVDEQSRAIKEVEEMITELQALSSQLTAAVSRFEVTESPSLKVAA